MGMLLQIGAVIVAIVLLAIALWLVFNLKQLLVNAVLGVIALLVINYLGKEFGVKLAITPLTVIISAIFGLAGVGLLLVLSVFGIAVA